jgi:hypothetical protein
MDRTVRGSNPCTASGYSFLRKVQTDPRAPNTLLSRYWSYVPTVTWSRRQVNHANPSSAEVTKNECSYDATACTRLLSTDSDNFSLLSSLVRSHCYGWHFAHCASPSLKANNFSGSKSASIFRSKRGELKIYSVGTVKTASLQPWDWY